MNKVIVVTGGTDGLGKCLVDVISNNPDYVVISLSRKINDGNVLKKSNIIYFECDISNYGEIDSTISTIIGQYKRIDCLINNAGIIAEGSFSESSYATIEKMIDINTKGTMYVTRSVIPIMKSQKNGYIINIVSQGGLLISTLKPIYNTSKWAITGFTRCIEQELLPFGIKVSGIYPGTIKTGIFKKNNIPNDLKRAIEPNDLAQLINDLIKVDNSMYVSDLSVKFYR